MCRFPFALPYPRFEPYMRFPLRERLQGENGMAMTVNNLGTISLLNILNRTSSAQSNVLHQMATGSKINSGRDDPAGLLAISSLDSELTSVDAGIISNQRTDAILGVADSALGKVSSLLDDIQRLANETANTAGLTADEISANQSQIDDALVSIDRIVNNTQFNGQKLLDGSLAITTQLSGAAGTVTDARVFRRQAGSSNATLAVKLVTAASSAQLTSVMTTCATADTTFTVQGALGTAVITALSTENVSSVAYKINQAKAQTGVSSVVSGTRLKLTSTSTGSAQFVRTKVITGQAAAVAEGNDTGADAVVTVNGQKTAVDGKAVTYTGGGISLNFNLGTLTAGTTVGLKIFGDASGKSGATFQLGTNSTTRATLGIDGVYAAQLGNMTDGYLQSVGSGGTNSLINNPAQAAIIARAASKQVTALQGRIGGFQKFQVQTSIDALNDTKEGLSKAKSVIQDVDYATATAELNKQNILLQSAMSLLGLANQQSSQVLSLLK
jgi:flagellin